MSRNRLLEKLAERKKRYNRPTISTWVTGKTMEKAMGIVEAIMGKTKIKDGMIRDPQFSTWKIGEQGMIASCLTHDAIEHLTIAIPSAMTTEALDEANVDWEKGVNKIPFAKQLKNEETFALVHSDIKGKMKEFKGEQLELTFKQPTIDDKSKMDIHGVKGNTKTDVYGLKYRFYDRSMGVWVTIRPPKQLSRQNLKEVRGIIQISKLKQALDAMSKVDTLSETFRIHSYTDETYVGTSENELTGFVTELGSDEVASSMSIPVDYKSRGYQNKGGMTGLSLERLKNFVKTLSGEAVIEFGENRPLRIIGAVKGPEPIYYEYLLANLTEPER